MFISKDNASLRQYLKLATIRQCIWYKKEKLKVPRPWSNDEKLNNIFFCNVFRTQDKATIELRRIYDAFCATHKDRGDQLRVLVALRHYCNIETMQYLEQQWLPDFPEGEVSAQVEKLINVMRIYAESGRKVYTSAYLTNGGGLEGLPKWMTTPIIVSQITSRLWDYDTLEELCEDLRQIKWVGGFVAYEFATDMSYYKTYADIDTWANNGPGATRGASLIYKGNISTNALNETRHVYQELINEIYSYWRQYIVNGINEDIAAEGLTGNQILDVRSRFIDLNMREVEHWLCEYFKYCKGTGGKHRVYP
jgi:hypothetical protein